MGYKYIGLGGLVRTRTPDIIHILEEVHNFLPYDVQIHLFGIGRLVGIREFVKNSVHSIDSASLLRRAWLGTGQNYISADGVMYAAIRIPEAGKSFRAKRMVIEGRASAIDVIRMEKDCWRVLREYDAGLINVETTLDVIDEYDKLITPNRQNTRPLLRRTLEDMPWKHCDCDICKKDGIQVVIFRGNNRNRRRGFHNTYHFYKLFQRVLNGENISIRSNVTEHNTQARQMSLFDKLEIINDAEIEE